MSVSFGYTIVYVPDVSAALDFYGRAFGLKRRFLDPSGTYGELETGATALAFAAESLIGGQGMAHHLNRPQDPAPGIELALVTPDVPKAYATALSAGATDAHAPQQKPWGQTVAYVRDLNGVLVELCTPVAAAT